MHCPLRKFINMINSKIPCEKFHNKFSKSSNS